MEPWTRKRILILGMTYPSYSKKYVENTCTGGLEEGTGRMVRIHPVPRRYLDEAHQFQKFQWITAKVMPHGNDPRPESLRVEPDSIELGEVIPAKNVDERRRLIESSPHMFRSVEELRDRWDKDRTSLGTIRPKEIKDIKLVRRSASEREEWLAKENELFSQTTFEFERPPKRIDFPEVEFRIAWICDDSRCESHEMGIMQWGLHQLYRKYAGRPDGAEKVKQAMWKDLNLKERDVFFFLGNFRTTMWNFGLMDSFSPGKPKQLSLF
ncbi:hypothetical protein [Polyangium aurulentum]|uniref:hypothetical protein n=1 Tax=Polyangium aurulentum TaxID=2567896 RepID=UPI0010AE51DE|nr:hypothetical protein [Polyangium aurulentum]UQA62836.1 hypothetical protein E8A73_021240 [Polyangium aurulentum]